jgi:DMSO/TMAO reductase YedYZ molybdopterin-dependent catalytic subunit
MKTMTRRKLLTTGMAAAAGAAGLAEAARLASRYGIVPPDCGGIYGPGETLTYAASRVLGSHALAREFPRSMISEKPFANDVGKLPATFLTQQAAGFRDWTLTVDGLVAHPTKFSLQDLKTLGQRSQITEVSCEEGWSYIAEWIGTPMADVLREVQPLPQARYMAYFSAQEIMYESLDMEEAMHPQTQLTWAMNNGDLPVGFGGPLRMRVPRQLGYKSLKYVDRITITDSMKRLGKGEGGIDPDYGYAWYAGI